ncbi:hypothetical protein V498_00175 [Pseudogymnoascus sp. VKM F-4517 (FW-2822)]|nr:hypothetical protein V498_00175 [Pseudogymnoascus sp. VKM F-4517 (FW-2822)]
MGSIEGSQCYDVIVIGGGFGGLYQLHHLRKLGFSVHLFEAGSRLGGTWYWNCYPGARVDTEVPGYQFSEDETWDEWNWSQRYPGRDELLAYFMHVDRVWDLSRDISFNSRVASAHWESDSKEWVVRVGGQYPVVSRSRFAIFCTGFASKPYTPSFLGVNDFKGAVHHTAEWPQEGIELKGRRVGVIGTGASGVQVIQECGPTVSHLKVFQRTPNLAIPMGQENIDEAKNKQLKASYSETKRKIHQTFAGFLFQYNEKTTLEVSDEVRTAFYENLWSQGGLNFALGNYKDMLHDRQANSMAYAFWREKTIKRLIDPAVAEKLAPKVPPHPFATKRASLERNYFEVFNQSNVDLVDTASNPIEKFVSTGIQTKDGVLHELDVVVFATGFDSIAGGITNIDIRGVGGISLKDKWANGVQTSLGMATAGFPNVLFVYGPQAPTAFATGPVATEIQGDWIVELLRYMRREGLVTIEPATEAEVEWRAHVNDIGNGSLFHEANSFYFGGNIPGKAKEAMNYMGGLQVYKEKITMSSKNGYKGFHLS